MKMKVTDQGVTIPKQMLEGAQEVEVRQEGHRLILIPLQEEDPIWDSGAIRSPAESQTPQRGMTTISMIRLNEHFF